MESLTTPASSLSSSLLCEEEKIAAIHNASRIAASTEKAERNTTPSGFAERAKIAIELEIVVLRARLVLLQELSTMTDEEKMECLFRTLDKNRDGSLSVVELADGLRKINSDVDYEESLVLAMDRVASFDTNGSGKLQLPEFSEYATKLAEAFGATFHYLAEMLILSVVFSEDGNSKLESETSNIADEIITEALRGETDMTKIMGNERTKVLFRLFDLDADGLVNFQRIIMGLYKVIDDLNSTAAGAVVDLLNCDYGDAQDNKSFDFRQFSEFLVRLVSATGQAFDDIVDKMIKATIENSTNNMTREGLLITLREMAER